MRRELGLLGVGCHHGKLTSGPSFAIFAPREIHLDARIIMAKGGISMYAVIQTGGKQYRVSQGDLVTIEKIEGVAGDQIEINSVLMIGEGAEVAIGQPHLPQARVVGTIVRQERGPKLLIYKHKRRKGYQKKQGHRQSQTLLRVTGILTGSAANQT